VNWLEKGFCGDGDELPGTIRTENLFWSRITFRFFLKKTLSQWEVSPLTHSVVASPKQPSYICYEEQLRPSSGDTNFRFLPHTTRCHRYCRLQQHLGCDEAAHSPHEPWNSHENL